MSTLKDALKEEFKNFPSELINDVRQSRANSDDEIALETEIKSIHKATLALLEAKVEDKKIISLLQKYWDLRRSEAEEFLSQAKRK